MAQKTNPISLRLQQTNRFFDNSWYSKKYYDKLIVKDIHIQKYMNTFLKLLKLPASRLSIQHIPQKTRLFSFFCYPKVSRSVRSKMFGIYVPHFFKQQNKWVSRNKKYSSNLLVKKSKLTNFKPNWTTNKLLCNNNLMNNSLFHLTGTYKMYSLTNQLIKKKFNGKNEKWSKNLFFVNYYSNFIKLDNDKNFNKLTTSTLLEIKSQKISCNLENSNTFFLKFILNLVIQNKFNARKRHKEITSNKNIRESKDSKILKLQNIEMKPLLKYFLIINTFQKNIYNWENQIFFSTLKNKDDTIKKVTLFNTKLLNYLNNNFLSNNETHQNRIFSDHYTGSKILKTDHVTFDFAQQHSPEIMSIKLKKQTNTHQHTLMAYSSKSRLTNLSNIRTIQDILEIIPNKKISLLENNSHLLSNYNFTHGLNSFENKQVLSIENNWKLEHIENKYKYKNYIQRSLAGIYNLDFEFIPFKIINDWQNAGFLADEIVYFLERRVPFRRFKNKLLKYISRNSNIRGIRITCSGRVGGKSKKAQRAKTECVKLGQTSLHVFSNKIDFAIRTAHTSFGSVGIKVWISYNS